MFSLDYLLALFIVMTPACILIIGIAVTMEGDTRRVRIRRTRRTRRRS